METINKADQMYNELLNELEKREDFEKYQGLIAHPQFEKIFKKRYKEFAGIGATIDVIIGNNGIVLRGKHEYDSKFGNDTSFAYQGRQTITSYQLGIEYAHDREYLCEREEQADVLRFKAQNESELSWTSGLTVYYGNEEICKASNYKERFVPSPYWQEAYFDTFSMKPIPIGYALGGEIPSDAITNSPKCIYNGMTRVEPGSNIIKQINYVGEGEKTTTHTVAYGTASSRYPTTLDDFSPNLATQNIVTGETHYKSQCATLEECLRSVPSTYEIGTQHTL